MLVALGSHQCIHATQGDSFCVKGNLGVDNGAPMDSQVIRGGCWVAHSESKTKEILQADATSFRR
jgi:hypothetical protein